MLADTNKATPVRYVSVLLAVTLAALIRWPLVHAFGELPVFITFFPAVALIAMLCGGGPAALATVLSVIAVFTAIPPAGRSHLDRTGDIIAGSIFLFGGGILSLLALWLARLRRQLRSVATQHAIDEKLRQSEERFSKAFHGSSVGLGIVRLSDNRIVDANAAAMQLFGYCREEMIGRTTLELALYRSVEDKERLRKAFQEQGSVRNLEVSMQAKSGKLLWVLISGQPIMLAGEACVLVTLVDITTRKQTEQAMQFLAQSGAAPGESFFQGLARYLAQSMGMDFICIDRLEGELLTARTLALYCDGKFEDNIYYTLKDTPCADVVAKTVCCFPQGVRHLFPKDAVLQQLQAESYVGTTLLGSQGNPIGLIAMIGRRPLADPQLTTSILQIAALRAASELEHQQANETLRDSEERYRLLAENTEDFVQLSDTNGNTLYLSPSIERLLGITANDVEKGVPILHPDDRETVHRAWELNMAGQATTIEYRNRGKDGNWVWLESHCKPIRDSGGQISRLLLVGRDITLRKAAEEALRESEERYRGLVEQAVDGIFLADAQGHYLDANTAGAQMLGYTLDEIRSMKVADVIVPEEIARMSGQISNLAGGEVSTSEWRFRRKDGSTFLGEIVGRRLPDDHLLGILRDVTAHRETELELRRLSVQRQLALDAARLGWWQYNPITRIAEWDDGYKAIFGVSGYTQPTDQILAQIIHPEDRPALWAKVEEALNPSAPQPFAAEYRINRPDGTQRWVEAYGLPTFEGEGASRRAVNFVGTVADITDRKRAEEELKAAKQSAEKAKAAAEAASKAKDQFIAALSHELRTPLTPVLTTLHLMESDPRFSAADRESLIMIRRNVELEVRLIDDLLDLTRISRGKVALHNVPVDLHDIQQWVVRICDSEIRSKQLKLHLDLKARRHWVRGDAARLQQILWNLLKNAVKFTPADGAITIRTSNPTESLLSLSVTDTGVGINPTLLPHLFDAFEQGEYARQFGGLGLGLAISKSIAELHGGTLRAASDGKQKGASFTLELETCAPAKPTDNQPVLFEAIARKATGRILLVEDHPDTSRTMKRLLKKMGYEVRMADTVSSALQCAQAEPFDILISDIGLPDGSGLDLMRQLSLKSCIKGIAISGFGMEEDLRMSKEAGFIAHLTKPVNIQMLEQLLKDIFG